MRKATEKEKNLNICFQGCTDSKMGIQVGRGQEAASLRVEGNCFHFYSTFSPEMLHIFNVMRSQK